METEPQKLLNVLERLGAKKNGSSYVALCPAHADKNPSLKIDLKNGRILLWCGAGCTTEAICDAAGIKMGELFLEQGPEKKIVATYDYVNEKGKTLYQVVRFDPKGFSQRKPDGKGGWIWKLGDVRRVLFHLPEVLAATDVLIVEGEKDCEAARKLGFTATTNAGGAGKWRPEYSVSLLGKNVTIVADNDEPGKKHALEVATALYLTAEIKLIEKLPSLFDAKDLTDWLAEGNNADDLKALIAKTPVWTPDEPAATVSAADAKPEAESQEAEADLLLPDMPADVLDGFLGEVCREKMKEFPVAYAWPSLLAVASVLMDRRYEKTRSNLYVCLAGPVGTSKSAAIQRAIEVLGLMPPTLMETVAGSAEGLMKSKEISEANGDPRLYSPDELGHMLEKAKIENSSFAYILNMAYYKTKFKVIMAQGKEVDFNCALSVLGGLVDARFEDLFGSLTTGGLYDRFIFGLCPTGYEYKYTEQEVGSVEIGGESGRPVDVRIDPSVWDTRNSDWSKEFPESRVPELALRVAVICAAFDRRRVLTSADLKPARAFADYQKRVRYLLKPNPGKNADGIISHKITEYLKRKPGEWVNARKMFQATRAYDFGPGTAQRVLNALQFIGDVETISDGKDKRTQLVRLTPDPTTETIEVEF